MRKTQKTAVVGGAVAALMVGGVAFAAWSSNGSGDGSATAGSSQNFSVTSGAITGLYPTGSFPATVTASNPNAYKLAVTDLALASVSTTAEGCNAADAGIITATITQFVGLAPAKTTTNGTATTPVSINVSNDLNDACKDATFTLHWTATGNSAN